MSDAPTFTVFTAAYNRPATLARVHAALAAQSMRDFEWLIIDDGSGPEVAQAVQALQQLGTVAIRFVWQPNAGKHAAHNRAVELARGRYFVVLDDDDSCEAAALERFAHHWAIIEQEEAAAPDAPPFCAVMSLCQDQHGTLFGSRFPTQPYDTDYLTYVFRTRLRGERFGCWRTSVLRAYPYPVAPGPSAYMLEAVPWYRMARRYRTRFINEILRTWYVGHDSVSSAQARRRTDYNRIAPTMAIVHGQTLGELIDSFGAWPAHFLKSAADYGRFAWRAGHSLRRQWATIGNRRGRVIWLVMLPAAAALYLRDGLLMARRARAAGRAAPSPAQHEV